MIYQTVTVNDVIGMARDFDRLDQFGSDGWRALFGFMEELSEDTGVPMELDIIAWCCEFTRWESIEEYNNNYNTDFEDPDEIDAMVILIDDTAFITSDH